MKMLCPAHKDTNPSLHIYEEFAHCFVCGFHVPVGEVISDKRSIPKKAEPTDIKEMLKYVKTLPTKEIRGLKFRTNKTGYYVVWPDSTYYKKRLFGEGVRYLAPRGVRPPLFSYAGKNTIFVIEGEINCMSIKHAYPEHKASLVSPGSAGELTKFVKEYLLYRKVYIIIDSDAAGVTNGLKLKDELRRHHKQVELIDWKQDANSLLVQGGKDAIKEKFKKEGLELPLLSGV